MTAAGPLATPLQLERTGDDRWTLPHPEEDPEKRDVVFSGQILAQMMMVATAAIGGDKAIKSVHAVFARAGAYSAGPIEYVNETLHTGRAWASTSITAYQGPRLLSRSVVLLDEAEPDLIRHSPRIPEVPAPADCPVREDILTVFPGSEVRSVEPAGALADDGSPTSHYWVRVPQPAAPVPAKQAAIAWCEPGFIIGTALQSHRDGVRISDAHRTISTGVISHTSHFHDRGSNAEWILVSNTASFAGHGRVFGQGTVFEHGGALLSTFGQDAMARSATRPLDPQRSL